MSIWLPFFLYFSVYLWTDWLHIIKDFIICFPEFNFRFRSWFIRFFFLFCYSEISRFFLLLRLTWHQDIFRAFLDFSLCFLLPLRPALRLVHVLYRRPDQGHHWTYSFLLWLSFLRLKIWSRYTKNKQENNFLRRISKITGRLLHASNENRTK